MRTWMLGLFGIGIVAVQAVPGLAATDLTTMQAPEIEALQKRLTDAGCYRRAIDGQASTALTAAVEACPDQEPALRIETGMHTARIFDIGVDAQCDMLATGSDDKTVRLWSMPDGKLVRTMRLPIGPKRSGQIRGVSISPDGKLVAAGGIGNDTNGIYIFNVRAGGTVRRLIDYEQVIDRLAFSPDGHKLAVALRDNGGVRVLDVDNGRELMADRDYRGDSYGLTFGPDGALYATADDRFLRRYGPNLKREAAVETPGREDPFGVAVDPSGHRLVVGYDGGARVDIFDALTLKRLDPADTRGQEFEELSRVAWSTDGSQIAAGGRYPHQSTGQELTVIRSFTSSGRQKRSDVPVAHNTIMSLTPCGSEIAFATSDPTFGLLHHDGTASTLAETPIADMRGKRDGAFMVSSDGTRLRFGIGFGEQTPILFDLKTGLLDASPLRPSDLQLPKTSGLDIENWRNETNPTISGRLINLESHEMSRSLAIKKDLSGFVIGSDYAIRGFSHNGDEKWNLAVSAEVRGVNFSKNGDLIVAAYTDGTIRWHRWSDGKELLALFVHAPTKRWVAWTPTGYYMASPGGEDLIGWQVNRGWEQEGDFFPASRFRDRFNRPDVIRRMLTTLDEGEAVRQADAEAHKRPSDAKPLIDRLPPVVTIVSPTDGVAVPPGTVEIRYRTRMPSGGTVERVEAFVDGAKVEARGLAPAAQPVNAEGEGTIILPIPSHDALVSLVAYAGGKASDAASVTLKSTAMAPDDALKPNLYALLVGIGHYDAARYNLSYPTEDAVGLADALKSQEGKLYRHVEVKVLTDKDATATGMKRGLAWLKRQTTAHDLAIVFAAGHGTTDAKGKFWFLSSDMDPDEIEATSVSQDDIENVLFDLPGKKLLFLDACHSGAALNAGARGTTDVSAAVSDFGQAEGGVVAYAASTGREFSFERDEWGHGAFTKALIEGLSGKADLLHKGTVTTGTLDLFLEQRVKELTGGQQHPVMTRPKTVPDFPIAAVN